MIMRHSRLKCIVKRSDACEQMVQTELPHEQTANILMSTNGYSAYVRKHGYHFTDALAEHVSRLMVNANGREHSWSATQVEHVMANLGLSIPATVTTGDVTYLANMVYADLVPEVLGDDISCLRAAYALANDPDGYEGMTFRRWTADVAGKQVKIEWAKYI